MSGITPWGDAIELTGTGNFTFGYIGGILDVATGLLYVGNGQYYDPTTGRFLTRGVNPDSPNPYVPWNPIGAIIGPLALFSLVARRRKSKANPYLLMLLMLVLLPLSVGLACGTTTPTPTEPTPPVQPQTPVPVTDTPSPVTAPPTSTPTPTPPTPTPTPCNCTPTPMPSLALYDIDFDGTAWSLDEQTEILEAIQKVGEGFARFLGMTSDAAFRAVYGDKFIFYRNQSGATYCQGGQRRVVCSGNAPLSEVSPDRLLVHELAHALVQTRYGGSLAPYITLGNAQIVDDYPESLGGPRWVTGTHPTRQACESDPNLRRECTATNKLDQNDPNYNYRLAGQFERTGLGYKSTLPPDLYHGSNWDDWLSNDSHTARNEDFADMFMNWAYNTFDYSPEAYNAGLRRYEFMENNMLAWITG